MQRSFFFFNDTATTEIYTLSLHDALPISVGVERGVVAALGRLHLAHDPAGSLLGTARVQELAGDRKSTRLNSSHDQISYAVFCLKKKSDVLFFAQTTAMRHIQQKSHCALI